MTAIHVEMDQRAVLFFSFHSASTWASMSAWPDRASWAKARVNSSSRLKWFVPGSHRRSHRDGRALTFSCFSLPLLWLETRVRRFSAHSAIEEKMIICTGRRDRRLHTRQICHKYCFHCYSCENVSHEANSGCATYITLFCLSKKCFSLFFLPDSNNRWTLSILNRWHAHWKSTFQADTCFWGTMLRFLLALFFWPYRLPDWVLPRGHRVT